MISTLTTVHAIISILLVLVVLLQFGKGAEAGLMGETSGSVFTSSQQGNILTKITTVLAILFLGLSVGLASLRSRTTDKSVLDGVAPIAAPLNSDLQKTAPAQPNNTEAPAKKEETKERSETTNQNQ